MDKNFLLVVKNNLVIIKKNENLSKSTTKRKVIIMQISTPNMVKIEIEIKNPFKGMIENRKARKEAIKKIKKMNASEIAQIGLTTTKKVDSDKVTKSTEKIQEATKEIILNDGSYFVLRQNVIPMRKALKENGLSEVSKVVHTNGADDILVPRTQPNSKNTIIPTSEWNKKIKACPEVMALVKNGKATPYERKKVVKN